MHCAPFHSSFGPLSSTAPLIPVHPTNQPSPGLNMLAMTSWRNNHTLCVFPKLFLPTPCTKYSKFWKFLDFWGFNFQLQFFSEFPFIIPPSLNFPYPYVRSPFHNLYLNILFRSKSMNILVQIQMKLYCLRCLVKYECAVSHFIGLPCVYLCFGLPVLTMGLRGVSTCIFFLLLSNKTATPNLLGGEDDSQGMVRMIKRAKVILASVNYRQ